MDTYSKCALTVIAACLVWMCARDFTPIADAHAQMGANNATMIKFPKELYDCTSSERRCWLFTKAP